MLIMLLGPLAMVGIRAGARTMFGIRHVARLRAMTGSWGL